MPIIKTEHGFRWAPNSGRGSTEHIGKNVTIRMAKDVGIIVDYLIEDDSYAIDYPGKGRLSIDAKECTVQEWE